MNSLTDSQISYVKVAHLKSIRRKIILFVLLPGNPKLTIKLKQHMQILQPVKGISWTEVLTGMQKGQEIPDLDLKVRNTVAPLISRQLSISHPGMQWRTKKTSATKFKITRTA